MMTTDNFLIFNPEYVQIKKQFYVEFRLALEIPKPDREI